MMFKSDSDQHKKPSTTDKVVKVAKTVAKEIKGHKHKDKSHHKDIISNQEKDTKVSLKLFRLVLRCLPFLLLFRFLCLNFSNIYFNNF
jgi:hypothetical protein